MRSVSFRTFTKTQISDITLRHFQLPTIQPKSYFYSCSHVNKRFCEKRFSALFESKWKSLTNAFYQPGTFTITSPHLYLIFAFRNSCRLLKHTE